MILPKMACGLAVMRLGGVAAMGVPGLAGLGALGLGAAYLVRQRMKKARIGRKTPARRSQTCRLIRNKVFLQTPAAMHGDNAAR